MYGDINAHDGCFQYTKDLNSECLVVENPNHRKSLTETIMYVFPNVMCVSVRSLSVYICLIFNVCLYIYICMYMY